MISTISNDVVAERVSLKPSKPSAWPNRADAAADVVHQADRPLPAPRTVVPIWRRTRERQNVMNPSPNPRDGMDCRGPAAARAPAALVARKASHRLPRFVGQIGVLGWVDRGADFLGSVHRALARPTLWETGIFWSAPCCCSAW